MPRTCIRFFAILLLLLVAVPALQAAPLLQEGKKTLYQRVVSHPGAMPLKEARDGAPAAREMLPSSATVTKYRSILKSIYSSSYFP